MWQAEVGLAMTPEDWANRMARHIIGENMVPDSEACRECIEIATQAIREEREACARVVEDWAKQSWPTNTDGEAESIANAIRARGE
jgi:hypothetical protein